MSHEKCRKIRVAIWLLLFLIGSGDVMRRIGLIGLLLVSICLAGIVRPVQAQQEDRQEHDYVGFYGMDPETFDYLYTYKTVDSLHFANFIDGLLEHDTYGNLVGAMATHW